jgi:purine-binding chemotaxis protein CheW
MEPATDGLASLLQDLPPAGEPARGEIPPAEAPHDDRFTTWRPGDGAPPFVLPPPALGPIAPPHEDDFRVITVPGAVAPPPPAPAPARAAHRDPLDEFFYRADEEAPELPRLAQGTAPQQEPGTVVREEYLTFLLGSEEYAVAIRHVREVVKSPPVTEVPRAPHHILGVVTVRGEVVAVIDPRRRLALPESGRREGKVVILDVGDGPCGLLVDDVANVVRLPPGAIEPCPQGIATQGSDCVGGIGREGERIFTVLDLGGLLRRAPARGADGPGLARRSDAGP